MAAVINTNIASLNTQRNLMSSQSALNTSIQRLSSGLRVNSAKDDAAGLAISERMTSQIRGLNVAARNANDGISLAQTAEGALGKVGDMLQRIRELAVQSANATNSTSDRTALNDEAAQLKAEIGRLASQTEFNGTKLLDGNFTNQAFQVGANQGQTIDVASIANANISALGSWNSVSTPAVAGQFTSNQVSGFDFSTAAQSFVGGSNAKTVVPGVAGANINFTGAGVGTATFQVDGTTVNLTADYSGDADATNIAAAIQSQVGSNYTVAASGYGITVTHNSSASAVSINALNANATTAGFTTSAGTAGQTAVAGSQAGFSVDGNAVALTTNVSSLSGLVTEVQSQLNSAAPGTYTVAAGSNGGISITSTTAGAANPAVVGSYTGQGSTVFAGSQTATAADSTAGTAQTGFAALDISSVDGANAAILAMDGALNDVNSSRATLGAVQSRFENAVSSIQIQSENISAARSRIVDADFAAETAALTRGQILQQAGTAMLAQANSLPNNVLSLLRG